MNKELIEKVMMLALEATDRICDDLTTEELETFKDLKVLRQDENGKVFLDKVMYQSDLVCILQAQLLGSDFKDDS